ncbi:hypothetical protein C8P68_1154 [Mucilaginibacter yixingensis]|uniref:Uncharacterized protein n=1 Tax=Mucilaginibacter yixingensis TaxID=1295612 RepID=A0A2T5J4C2_9SPHI|nr:hypothetical protein [Mucilaginibacter yixingensis]PTQ92008.1 hypothetical protein C8P68_1154 [Mucilaginibacter yixingensis]
MDYEIHGKIEKFEEFLRLTYKGINEKYADRQSANVDELWNCSLFLAKILHAAKPISNITNVEGLEQFKVDYEAATGRNIDLPGIFKDFWLRKIGDRIHIAGLISISCLTFEKITLYWKELLFLSVQQAQDKQNNMDTLEFEKANFEDVIRKYEQDNNCILDPNGIFFKKWSSVKNDKVTFSNIEAHFQGYLDYWERFEFILAYKQRIAAEENRSFLHITENNLEKIYNEHRGCYSDIPEYLNFINDSQFRKSAGGYDILFHASSSQLNYWHILANQISGRYWTLLDQDDQIPDKQTALKIWLFKTQHIDAHKPLSGATIAAVSAFCREAYLFLKTEPDFAGGRDEIRKMIYDSSFKGGFISLKDHYISYDMDAVAPVDVYHRLNDGPLSQGNTLYDQRSRHSVNKLINAFICGENKYTPVYDENGEVLPQQPYRRIAELLMIAAERPFLAWKICHIILHRRQEILPALFSHPQLAALGFVLADEMQASHPADPLNIELWQQSTSLFISCATRLYFRPKQIAKILVQQFVELNKDKYQDLRGSRPPSDPIKETARKKRETGTLNRLVAWDYPATFQQHIPSLFSFLCFYINRYQMPEVYRNRLVKFPMVQWDAIFCLMQMIDSPKFKTYRPALEPQLQKFTRLFLKSYLNLLETDEALGFDYHTKTDTVGNITWSESIERLDKLQWIYPIYHLYKYNLLAQFLSPRIYFEATTDILHEKNRVHILQLRTHIGVLLLLLKKLVSPEIPSGFEKTKLQDIQSSIEAQIVSFVRQYAKNDPGSGHFDLFEFNHETSLYGYSDEALLPRLARAVNWFSNKEAIITAIKTSGDYHKLLTMLEWITSTGIRKKLLEEANGADVLTILDKQHWIPEIKNILLQLSHNQELLEKLEEALVFYEVKVADARNDVSNKMEAFRIRLLIAYFSADEKQLDGVTAPVVHPQVHSNNLSSSDYRSFYRGLIRLTDCPESAYTIFNDLFRRFPQYTSLAINRLCAAYKTAEKNDSTTGFADALAEWNEASGNFTEAQNQETQPNISILLLQIYLKLGFEEKFDWLFNQLELPYQLLPDILQLKVAFLVERGRRAEAFYWIEKGEVYHKFNDIAQIQFLEDLKLTVKGLDNIDELQYQYKRIFDAVPEKLIQVIPSRLNGQTSMPEFLIQEFVHAADKMLEKIRSINEIKNEDKYNDLLEIILESRIFNYGWTVSGQKRGAFSGAVGPQPGERDLPIIGADTKIMLVGEALIYRGANNAVPHLEKIFNYYHQRENLLIIYYDMSDAADFNDHWANYETDILAKCQLPTDYIIVSKFTDVSADFKVNASAIKVGKTIHQSGTVIYHLFSQINYYI